MTPPDWADDEAMTITGPCSCDAAYRDRGLVDPTCRHCDCADDIAAALRTAWQRGPRSIDTRTINVDGVGERWSVTFLRGEPIMVSKITLVWTANYGATNKTMSRRVEQAIVWAREKMAEMDAEAPR